LLHLVVSQFTQKVDQRKRSSGRLSTKKYHADLCVSLGGYQWFYGNGRRALRDSPTGIAGGNKCENRRKQNQSENDNSNNSNNSASPVCQLDSNHGLYLDVPFKENKKIRVYLFVARLPENNNQENHEQYRHQQLELQGTEHDTYQFISIVELEALQPTVPGLAAAFHRATFGQFLAAGTLSDDIWTWASDKVNGASALAQQHPESVDDMKILRPNMVPIVNVLQAMQIQLEHHHQQQGQGHGEHQKSGGDRDGDAIDSIKQSLTDEVERSIALGVKALEEHLKHYQDTCTSSQQSSSARAFTIATFSRSSTLVKILQQFLSQNYPQQQQQQQDADFSFQILCGQSTPGDEGVLMAQDIDQFKMAKVKCIADEALHQAIREGKVQVVVVGADCLLEEAGIVVSKIGTKSLARTCRDAPETSILCCTDRWKIWDDCFPPPLEDIFECVPESLFDRVLVPQLAEDQS
jgi:translation initiation factor 2B subunit (eIF-2B alpha/beta/delta family)